MELAKYGVDFAGPQKILGVSVSPQDIRYRVSNIKHVQYLDLADSRLIIKRAQRDQIAFDFDKVFYHKFVNCILEEHETMVNKYLFHSYTMEIEKSRSRLDASAIFRYVKLFDLLGMGDSFLVARETALLLIEFLRQKNIENPVLMKAILKSVFKDKVTISFLIAFQSFANECIPTIARYDKCSLTGSLSHMFDRHRMCPVLGSAFAHNKTLLNALLNYNIKKRDFCYIFMPFHDILTDYPVYATFTPIVEGGLVVLDKNRLTSRDHLLFEIVITTQLAAVTDVSVVRDSLRLIYKCLPHPYISRSEMASRLNYLNPSLPESAITSAVCTYQSLFPEIGEETCPRSLQDLCRCTIRDSFNGKFSVNFAVETLKLPNKLMSFLKLEEDILGRKSGFHKLPRLQD